MLIIVEGPDGSGKTTLVNKINKAGIAKKIYGTHKDMPNQYLLWLTLMYECINDRNNNYIIDRCFISDWAYRISMNDGNPYITLDQIVELLKLPKVIYIFCDTDKSYELSQERGEDYVKKPDEHCKLRTSYNFIEHTIRKFCKKVNCITYDFEKDNSIDFFIKLHKLIEEVVNE